MSAKTSSTVIDKITFLRLQGNSIKEISERLSVPSTTVFRYAHTIKILPEYEKQWIAKRGGSTQRKLLAQERANKYAQDMVSTISKKELLLFICSLYWAEGNKKDLSLSNTDADLIKVFMRGLRSIFSVGIEDFKVSLRIYEDLDRETCIEYWSSVTGIERERITSISVLYGKKIGKLKYGMCRVRVKRGGEILKKIQEVNLNVVTFLANNSNI